MAGNTEFEKLWQRALGEPELKQVTSKKKVEVDLSLENVLDLYVAHARKGVTENRITRAVFDNLEKQTASYKNLLSELDQGGKLRSFTQNIGARIRRIF